MHRCLLSLWLLFLASTAVLSAQQTQPILEFVEPAMGTRFFIRVYPGKESEKAEAAAKLAFARVQELNAIFSDYDTESELRRFCSEPPRTKVKLSRELREVFELSQKLAVESGGAFDITVGPLIRLWRNSRRLRRLPTKEQLEEAFSRFGYEKLALYEDGTANLAVDGMRLDLGGIAKGYAADEALKIMREAGFPISLVMGSGDIAAGDPPPGEKGWKIGLTSLKSPDEPDHFFHLKNGAVSTSGDTEQFLLHEGVRYSHIVSPKTGLGLTKRRSVSVIAANATTTDCIATTLSISGIEGFRPSPAWGIREIRVMDGNGAETHLDFSSDQ